MALEPLEAIAGGALLLAAPGLAWCRALFPEWRLRGELAYLRAVETATMGVLLSLSLTVLVGYGLTFSSAAPFPAGWSDPILETILAAITGGGLVVAALRGGFAREPPRAPEPEPAPGSDSPEPLLRDLARLQREVRRTQHALRVGAKAPNETARLEERLRELRGEMDELRVRREEAIRG